MSTCTTPDVARIRKAFPALSGETIFLENAGGSQVPRLVADRMRDYMLQTYVQLDADYRLSQVCTETVEQAHAFVHTLMNGADAGKVILGPSTTALCRMLAGAVSETLTPGDEIVIAEAGHEANVGPWAKLERRGAVVKTWRVDPATTASPLEALERVITDRTRLVALPHVSNLLGEIVDLGPVVEMAHAAGARVVVDGVAFAPHRLIDVAAWGVDWYVYSMYKVYGPHMAALFGRHDALAELTGPNHFFIADDDVPYKFEPGGVSHEGCAAVLGLGDYLAHLAGRADGAAADRTVMQDAFEIMTACERPLIERLMGWLGERPGVRIVGTAHAGPSRVGTISFVHETRSSREIAQYANRREIGIRHGHMYAYRLCQALGLDPEDGVVRVSLVHYNSMDDIVRLIAVLEEIL